MIKLHDYLESSYAIVNIEVQTVYTPFKHAEVQAIADLTNLQRKIFKFFAYFKVIFQYLITAIGIKSPPKDAKIIIKEMNDAKLAEVEKAKADRANALSLVNNEPVPS